MDRLLRRFAAGFTLPEILVALAVLALLATQAVPALQWLLARRRLELAVTEARLALYQARRHAFQARVRLAVPVVTGPAWRIGCRPAATTGFTPCASSRRHPHVRLAETRPGRTALAFDGVRGLASPATLVFVAGGQRRELRIALSGRLRVCDPGAGTC